MPLQRPKPQCPGSLRGFFGAAGAWPQSASQDSPKAISHQASGWEFPAEQLCRGSTCCDDTRADPGLSWVYGAGRVLCLGDGALFWGSLLPKSLQAIAASPWQPEMAGAATTAVSGLRWVEPKSPHKGRGRPRGISHVDPSPTVRSASSGGTLGRTQFCILWPGF